MNAFKGEKQRLTRDATLNEAIRSYTEALCEIDMLRKENEALKSAALEVLSVHGGSRGESWRCLEALRSAVKEVL